MTRKQPTGPTAISLFAGCGGLDIGLEDAGFTTLVANDIEHHACESLRANQTLGSLESGEFNSWFETQLTQRTHMRKLPEEITALRRRVISGRGKHEYLRLASIIEGDIGDVSSARLLDAAGLGVGDLTLVAGGPPCQPFSRSGKRKNVETKEGRLFTEFVRIVDDLRPRWFLFENVKGLVLTKTDVLREECRKCSRSVVATFDRRLAYMSGNAKAARCECGSRRVEDRLELSARGSLEIIQAEFERLGYECHANVLMAADYGVPQKRERLFIVGSRDHEPFRWPSPTHRNPNRAPEAPSLFDGPSTPSLPWKTMWNSLWTKGHEKYGALDPERAVLWVRNLVRPHDEPVTWTLDRPSPTVGAHQGAKFALAPDGVPDEQLQRQQWHVRGRRQKDLPPVEVEHAMLSDKELLTLQSFPRYWYLYGTRMQRAFQVGNAVPPLLAKQVAQAILSSCEGAPPAGSGRTRARTAK